MIALRTQRHLAVGREALAYHKEQFFVGPVTKAGFVGVSPFPVTHTLRKDPYSV